MVYLIIDTIPALPRPMRGANADVGKYAPPRKIQHGVTAASKTTALWSPGTAEFSTAWIRSASPRPSSFMSRGSSSKVRCYRRDCRISFGRRCDDRAKIECRWRLRLPRALPLRKVKHDLSVCYRLLRFPLLWSVFVCLAEIRLVISDRNLHQE